MPKIIENLRSRLIEEAARQVGASGYGAMTVRSVASACGIGVGTVYNYFSSKDELVAAFMLEDWNRCLETIRAAVRQDEGPEPLLRTIHGELRSYAAAHAPLFGDADAFAGYASFSRRYHGVLRGQLAEPLRPFCPDDYSAQFIAEALLVWTMAGTDFDEIYSLIQKLF